MEDQRQIVRTLDEYLSRLDAGVKTLREARARAASLDEAWILKNLGVDGSSNVLVDGHLPELPQGWRWEELGAVAEVVGGITKDGKNQGTPGFVEVPYLRVANVQRGRLDLSSVATILASPERASALALQEGDVLLNEGGDRDKLARGWVWEGQIEDCIHQNHVFRARPSDAVHPEWLAWCANTYGTRWAQRHGRQSVNLASISLRTIKTMPIPVPPSWIQDERLAQIRGIVESASRVRSQIDASLTRAAALRRSLFTAAFTGWLTDTDSDSDRRIEDIGIEHEVLAG